MATIARPYGHPSPVCYVPGCEQDGPLRAGARACAAHQDPARVAPVPPADSSLEAIYTAHYGHPPDARGMDPHAGPDPLALGRTIDRRTAAQNTAAGALSQPVAAPGTVPGTAATSMAAAMRAWPKSGTQRQRVLEAILNADAAGRIGATDLELQRALALNPSSQRPRRVELVELGLVVDSGRTRRAEGTDWTVWAPSVGARKAWGSV